jgi:hypothetical protein
MDSFYCLPITKEYTTRGCNVKIDAVTKSDRVSVSVKNINSGKGSMYIHVLLPGNDKGYSDRDMHIIKTELNRLLDEYGDDEWDNIHFTNQILS